MIYIGDVEYLLKYATPPDVDGEETEALCCNARPISRFKSDRTPVSGGLDAIKGEH